MKENNFTKSDQDTEKTPTNKKLPFDVERLIINRFLSALNAYLTDNVYIDDLRKSKIVLETICYAYDKFNLDDVNKFDDDLNRYLIDNISGDDLEKSKTVLEVLSYVYEQFRAVLSEFADPLFKNITISLI